MDLKAIFEDNINQYSDHVDCDVAENFESTTLDKDNQSALVESGFSFRSVESSDIHVTVDECKALFIAKKQHLPMCIVSRILLTRDSIRVS